MLRAGERAVDLLYVQAGRLGLWSPVERPASVRLVGDTRWPANLPKAAAYFALWRNTGSVSPGTDLVPELIAKYQEMKQQAAKAGQRLVGLQIDHDCPTDSLQEYARFLKELREALPPEDLLSITALLDWFRPGTRVVDVLRWVNEYVPQFYDVEPAWLQPKDPVPIAKAINPSKWGPIFNTYGCPYRIGIATFGRIAWVKPQPFKTVERRYFRDLSPVHIVTHKEFARIAELHNDAGEAVVRYEAKRDVAIEYYRFSPGDIIEMVLPTQESVYSAYTAAKAFGGLCAGVVFFRWPENDEALVLLPDEVQDIIVGHGLASRRSQVEAEDGECALVGCANLYVRLGERYPKKPVSLWIHSSSELEYILPAERVSMKVRGPRTLEINIPPYAGEPRLYLGRAVTRDHAEFTLKTTP